MLARGVENDVLPTCLRHGIGVIPWSPLAGGWLSGRYRRNAEPPRSEPRRAACRTASTCRMPANQRKLDAADALGALADEAGMTLIELALAFVINHPAVTAAIIGPRTMEHLESQLPAAASVARRRVARPHRRDRPARASPSAPADEGYANPALEPAARRR